MKVKRLLALLMTLAMIFSLALPVTVFADDEEDVVVVEEEAAEEPVEEPAEETVVEEPVEETVVEEPVAEEPTEEAPAVEEDAQEEAAASDVEEGVEEEKTLIQDAESEETPLVTVNVNGTVTPYYASNYESSSSVYNADGRCLDYVFAYAANGKTSSDTITITLMRDTAPDMNGFVVAGNSGNANDMPNVILDLNGHTINASVTTHDSGAQTVLMSVYADLTIKDSSTVQTGKIISNDAIFVVKAGDASYVTLESGTLTSTLVNGSLHGVGIVIQGDDPEGHILLKGGTFSGNSVTNWNLYVDTGKKVIDNGDNTFSVVDAYVAKIGSNQYTSLADAIAAVTTSEQTTITMLADVTENVTVAEGQSIVLDLAGKTINGGTVANSPTITNNGTLEIKDTVGVGTVKREDTGTSGYYVIDNAGTLTISSGNFTNNTGSPSAHSGASLIRTRSGASTTIAGGTLTQQYFNVLKDEGNCTTNITGGTINCAGAEYAILTYGTLNISGGTITGPVDIRGYKDVSGAATISGGTFKSKFYVEQYTGYPASTKPSLTITGGSFTIDDDTFNVGAGKDTSSFTKNPDCGTIAISGGVFSTEPNSDYVAEGYEVVANPDEQTKATYPSTVTKKPVAQINDTTYTSLADAFAAANEAGNATITVLANCELAEPVTIGTGKEITLNLDGRTVTVAKNDATVAGIEVTSSANGGKALTVNGTEFKTTNACGATLIQNNGTLTITGNGAIDGSAVTDEKYIPTNTLYLINNEGTLTINNGDFDMNKAIKSVVVRNKGTATLSAGTYDAWSAVLNDDGGTMNLNGGTYTGWGYSGSPANTYRYAVAQYGHESHMIISDGVTVSGIHGGLGVSEGYLTVNGGSFSTRNTQTVNADGTVNNASNKNTYYAGYFAGERGNVVVEINGGTFESAGGNASIYVGNDNEYGDGGLNMPARVTINNGTFRSTNAATSIAAGTGDAVIYGGTYIGKTFQNQSYVAEGYAAVKTVDESIKTWQVGKIKTTTDKTITEAEITNNTATYTVTTSVVESSNESNTLTTLGTDATITVNGTTDDSYKNVATTSNTSAVGGASLSQLKNAETINSIIQSAIGSAGASAGEASSITVVLVSDNGNQETDANENVTKVTYEVHPEAIVYNSNDTAVGAYAISNEELGDTTFTITLPVPETLSTEKVLVTHIHADGSTEILGTETVTDGKVTIEGVKSFSDFVLEQTSDGQITEASFLGASIRRRVLTSDHSTVVDTSTDIRLSYSFTIPTEATLDTSYFYWAKGDTVDTTTGSKVQLTNYTTKDNGDNTTTYTANLVITKVPSTAYAQSIASMLVVNYTYGVTEHSATITGSTRSVQFVCNAIIQHEPNTDWATYAQKLLDAMASPNT